MRIIGEFAAAVEEAEVSPEVAEPKGFLFGPDQAVFYIDPDIGFIPFGKFAQAAVSGLDTVELDGAAAVMDMMHDMLGANPGEEGKPETARTKHQEWARFQYIATEYKVKLDVILDIITKVLSGDAGRPTQQPSVSSDGQSKTVTSPSSKRKSSRSKDASKATADKGWIRPEFEPVTPEIVAELAG